MSMGCARIPPIDNHRLEEPQPMSEVREAVRSRYASVARQIAVIPNPAAVAGGGCCQADGPDCGCSGSDSPSDLNCIAVRRPLSLVECHPTLPRTPAPA